ncbi:unnamed protein product [Echinostoma caproni]|uniref:DUF1618 domain-containing protein n=1 Tax=Echinostoma caproni TaxID=27848 RepID=A0A183B8V7_9TREM|nr:unnamed protein product [Echinostoma caproni]
MERAKLTNRMFNSRLAIDCIPVDQQSPCLCDLQGILLPIDRVLGVQWESEKDEFLFQLQLPERTATPRETLSSLASLYDPMGFTAPWLLPGKILLKDLCRKKVTWDETLYGTDHKTWQGWWMNLSNLGDIRLPRPIPEMRRGEASELHAFVDSSEVGYGVVAYSFSSWPGKRRHNACHSRRSGSLSKGSLVAILQPTVFPRQFSLLSCCFSLRFLVDPLKLDVIIKSRNRSTSIPRW